MSAFTAKLSIDLSSIPELSDTESLDDILNSLDGVFEPTEPGEDDDIIDCDFIPAFPLPDEETMNQSRLQMTNEEIFDLDKSLEQLLGIR